MKFFYVYSVYFPVKVTIKITIYCKEHTCLKAILAAYIDYQANKI